MSKPEVLSIRTRYGKVGWVIYSGGNLFSHKFYPTKQAALKALGKAMGGSNE